VRRVLGFSCSYDLVQWTGSDPGDLKIALPLFAREIWEGYGGGNVRGKPITTVEVVIQPDQKDDQLCRERVARYKDLLMESDPNVNEGHFYGMGVLPYEGVYIGFPVRLDVCAHIPHYGDDGPMYVELAFSRDLRHWHRENRTVVIPNGPPGSWDGGMINVASKPIIRGEEIWLYYGGIAFTHASQDWYMPKAVEKNMKLWRQGQRDAPSGIGLAKWRLDGFVSLDAGEATGMLLTKPLIFSGTQLEINSIASFGSVAVEIQDADGRPVEGFTLADCDPLTTDAIHHVVTWKGKSNVTLIAGNDVRLKFAMKNASLYAFQFIGSGPSLEAVGMAKTEEP